MLELIAFLEKLLIVITPLVGAIVLYLQNRQAREISAMKQTVTDVKKVIEPIPEAQAKAEEKLIVIDKAIYALDKRVDGRLSTLLEEVEKASGLAGEKKGREMEKSDQRERDAALMPPSFPTEERRSG